MKEKCVHHTLAEERIVLVGSSEGPDHLEDDQNHFFITNEEGCSYRTMFERYLLKHDLHYFQTMEYRSD
nr:hypothetical protein [Bacillus sp. NSP9.1]